MSEIEQRAIALGGKRRMVCAKNKVRENERREVYTMEHCGRDALGEVAWRETWSMTVYRYVESGLVKDFGLNEQRLDVWGQLALLERLEELDGAAEAEQARWQVAIYEVLSALSPEAEIDGSGCDSGDPLDFTLSEIRQAIGAWKERVWELEQRPVSEDRGLEADAG